MKRRLITTADDGSSIPPPSSSTLDVSAVHHRTRLIPTKFHIDTNRLPCYALDSKQGRLSYDLY